MDKFYEHYMKMLARLPTRAAQETKESKVDDLKGMLTKTDRAHSEFKDQYFDWKVSEEQTAAREAEFENEHALMQNPSRYESGYHGRLSPVAKENLYREYHKGMSVKDLSLKYGILQQRVKAIIYQKHLYWEEIYPKLGESHMRLAIEREAHYAADFPFVEYGVDLHVMAELEKGLKVERLSQTPYDTDPPPAEKERINRYMMRARPRRSDRIPIELVGKGPAAYLLQEWHHHKGKGAPRVSETFRRIAHTYGTKNDQALNPKIRRRMDSGGIRYASLGMKHKF